jgi:hypothetical protein
MMTDLIARVDQFLDDNKVSKTGFGSRFSNSNNFVDLLRNGRELRPETVDKLLAFMALHEGRNTLPKSRAHYKRMQKVNEDSYQSTYQIVERNPCWRCGIRAEIGCDHQSPSAYEVHL